MDIKISALAPATAPDGSEEVAIVQGGATKKATVKEMVDSKTEMPAAYPPAGMPLNENQIMTVQMHRQFDSIIDTTLSDHGHPPVPTKVECVTAFKLLPFMDWAHDDSFYMRDTGGATRIMYFVKYSANGDTTEAGGNHRFWYELLAEAT